FRIGGIIQIELGDLGRIQASPIEDIKVEAAGVNVTSVLSTLHRWIKSPNEITGSFDQINNQIYVSAQWLTAPKRSGSGTESLTYTVSSSADINQASFDLACRIFLTRIAPGQPSLVAANENDFCVFSRAMLAFRDYVTARDRAPTDTEVVANLA